VKFRTERDNLLDALITTSRAASARGSLGGAPSLQLSLHGNTLELTGSDPDLVIESSIEVAGTNDGSILLPARLIVDIIRSLGAGAITFDGSSEEMAITSGKAEFKVRVPVGAEITRIAPLPSEGITLPAKRFAEGLRQVVRAALTDDARAPQLTGVLMAATERGIRLVATDSYRLAFCDLEGISALAQGSEVLIPARALGEIERLISASNEEDQTVLFRHSEFDAVFEVGNVKLTTRLLKGNFPDYQRLLPPSYPNNIEISRDELGAAVKRVRLMVRDSKDATTPVRINFSGAGAELRVLTPENGSAAEMVEGTYQGEDITVAFNPNYLLQGIEAVQSDTLTIELIDSAKPATLRSTGDANYQYLLMPVRVS
jgi:DNA polymerase-3 subunit beta